MNVSEVGELDRTTYIGGSRIAAITGMDRFGRTPLTEYLSIKGELAGTIDPARKLWLERRKRWEVPIIQMLREEFDGNIVAINKRYRDNDNPHRAAELDYEWADSEEMIQNGEIKTVFPMAFGEKQGWGEPGTGDVPDYIAAQNMWGLGIMGRSVCITAAMVGLDDMHFYRIEADADTIAWLFKEADDFWFNHVGKDIPPDPINMDDMHRLFSKVNGKPVEVSAAIKADLDTLARIRGSIAAMESEGEEIKFRIADYVRKEWGVLGDSEPKDDARLIYAGKDIAKWAKGSGAHLDQKRLAADHPEIKKQYTVPHYFRAIRMIKQGATQ